MAISLSNRRNNGTLFLRFSIGQLNNTVRLAGLARPICIDLVSASFLDALNCKQRVCNSRDNEF